MFVSFRQGIVRAQSTGPAMLSASTQFSNAVDLNVVSGTPILVTFAHYEANYLIAENSTVLGAWGTGAVGSSNAPLPTNSTLYLYWDINLATGQLTRGWTNLTPIYSASAPTNPQNGLMWFDTQNTVWSVYSKVSSNPGVWQNVIRCFAGTYLNSPTPMAVGQSQVSPPITGSFTTGNIILGTNLTPLRNQDGTLVNTATSLVVNQTSGQNVNFDTALMWCEATESIPAFSCVSFQANNSISLASNSSIVSGIVTEALPSGSVGQVVSCGVLVSDTAWSWSSSDINKPLFCSSTGTITLTPPVTGFSQQIGIVYDSNAVFIDISPPVRITGTVGQNAPSVGAPLVIGTDGIVEGMPSGGLLNIGGVSGSTFSVGSKGLLFSDGTSSKDGSSTSLCLGYVYNQLSTSTIWTITHNLNTQNITSVAIYDGSNNLIVADTVQILNANVVTITFGAPQSGRAILTYFI